MGGFFLDDFLLVFHDDFVVGDFDDFLSWNGEFGVGEAFNKWALYDNLLDSEIFAGDGKVDDFAEVGTFFSFNFEADEVEIEFDDFADFYDVVFSDELLDGVDNTTVAGIFADGFSV